MKTKIDKSNWNRKEHFDFFSQFDEPFFGLCVSVDCTLAYENAKAAGQSFFLYYLYRTLKAANSIENFRFGIIGEDVFLYDIINCTPTVARPDGTFGFSHVNYNDNEEEFYRHATKAMEKTKQSSGLDISGTAQNLIHISAVPFVDFTALSHARSFSRADSCPKISFGKLSEIDGVRNMSVAIHVHHGLADGYHIGLFVDRFQGLLNG